MFRSDRRSRCALIGISAARAGLLGGQRTILTCPSTESARLKTTPLPHLPQFHKCVSATVFQTLPGPFLPFSFFLSSDPGGRAPSDGLSLRGTQSGSGWPGRSGEGLAVGSLWRWLQKPEPDPKLLSPWPIPRLPGWVKRVNEPLSQAELDAVRRAAQRGAPLGDQRWVESIARRLNLESTMRPRGRPRSRERGEARRKEA